MQKFIYNNYIFISNDYPHNRNCYQRLLRIKCHKTGKFFSLQKLFTKFAQTPLPPPRRRRCFQREHSRCRMRAGGSFFRVILPFMVCSKLSPAADMDVGGQSVHIPPELIPVVGWIEFCEADIQIEIFFGSGRSDGFQCLIKKTRRFWDFVGFSAMQHRPRTFMSIHDIFCSSLKGLFTRILW
jgi:hypothetical protein